MVNSLDPDETARYEPFHLELHCLHRHLRWSAELRVNFTNRSQNVLWQACSCSIFCYVIYYRNFPTIPSNSFGKRFFFFTWSLF